MESSDYSGNSSTISTPSSFKRFWNFGFRAPDSPDTGFITRKNSCEKDLHKDFPGMSIDPPLRVEISYRKTMNIFGKFCSPNIFENFKVYFKRFL